jgi:hypothetical protein
VGVSSPTPATARRFRKASRRPRSLLAVDLYLLALLLVLAYLLAASILTPGFLANPNSVPPAILDARLDTTRAVVAFLLPLALVAVTAVRVRFAEQVTWRWTPLMAAWLVVAFAESLVAGPDFTAIVLALGAFPAVVIGHEQDYLRRAAGQSPDDAPWSPLRRRLTAIIALIVVIWIAAYIIGGVLGIHGLFGPLPFGWPGVQLPAGVGGGAR